MTESNTLRRLHTVRVIGTHVKLGALQELQYRTHLWTNLLSTIMAVVMSLAGVTIVYRQVTELNGWSRNDLLMLIGTFFVISGFINGVVHRSLSTFAADIHTGEFDYRLLKPVDAYMLSSIRTIDVWRIFDVLAGLLLVGIALVSNGREISIASCLLAPLLLVIALLLLASFWSLIAGLAFWTTRIEGALWALDEMLDNVRWPLAIYPRGLRVALSTIFPAGLAITVPAEALSGKLHASSVGLAVLMVIAMFGCSRLLWQIGIRRYSSASS